MIEEVLKNEGDTVESGEVIGKFKEGAAGESKPAESKSEAKAEAPKAEEKSEAASGDAILSPAARKLAEENNVDPSAVKGTGKDGRVTKEDVHGSHAVLCERSGLVTADGGRTAHSFTPVECEKSWGCVGEGEKKKTKKKQRKKKKEVSD